jgi:hypothetical protein
MYLTYGYDLKENDDLMILPARRTGEIMSKFVLPGAALVNHLPFREVSLSPPFIWLSNGYSVKRLPSWVPWFKYEPVAGECRELGLRMRNEPIEFVRNSMVSIR